MSDSVSSRRDLLSGRSLRQALERTGQDIADAVFERPVPGRGPTLMLRMAAMATDFDVLMNPEAGTQQVQAASAALDEVSALEQQYSVYRPDSELSQCNQVALHRPFLLESRLYRLLKRAVDIARLTDGAFHPAAGRLIQLWKAARREARLPTEAEIAEFLVGSDLEGLVWDESSDGDDASVQIQNPMLQFDLGAIGKGYAVDRAADVLNSAGMENWLIHGGKSSARVRGTHGGHDGWPVALQNPLLPDRPYLTLLLKDAALSTSGTAVQWFRHAGQRYGHILDPRSGWPVETMLSVSVIAPDAALSDALSTAFFVLGVEQALQCCDRFPEVGVILFPLPEDGRTLRPILHRVPAERLYPAPST